MNSTAAPRARALSRSSASTCACTVTSSAVVGSSAISSFGLQANAMAISTRWRMPPRARRDRGASPGRHPAPASRSASRSARDVASASLTFSWRRMTWTICRPMGILGFSAFIGSWKIIEASRPRISSSAASGAASTSRPSSRISPAVTRMAPSGSNLITDMAVTDLPEPDCRPARRSRRAAPR